MYWLTSVTVKNLCIMNGMFPNSTRIVTICLQVSYKNMIYSSRSVLYFLIRIY